MQVSTSQIKSTIINLIEQVAQDWEPDLDGPIDSDVKLVQDLGFASIDFIQLVVSVEDEFKQKLGFHDLLMNGGEYVEDLSVAQLVNFVESRLNLEAVMPKLETSPKPQAALMGEKVGKAQVSQFQATINRKITELQTTLPFDSAKSHPVTGKNSPAIFILSPPRSGSTLLRVILAGHPQLFAPPELHLLSYETLAQRKAALGNQGNGYLLQGTIRAIMQLKNCSAEDAQALMQEYETQNLSTREFYQLLQGWLGEKILVDKTPTYSTHLDILRRAEAEFEGALYIHLLRHPYGTIRSFEEAKLERIVPIMHEMSFSRRELAELTWLVSHENILAFLAEIPANRQFRLKFEDLVNQPQESVEQLCNFLGLNLQPEMLEPYKDKSQRMTDGVNVVSEMSGDLKFHLHHRIEPDAADRWKQYHSVDFLGDLSCELAQSLGYEVTV